MISQALIDLAYGLVLFAAEAAVPYITELPLATSPSTIDASAFPKKSSCGYVELDWFQALGRARRVSQRFVRLIDPHTTICPLGRINCSKTCCSHVSKDCRLLLLGVHRGCCFVSVLSLSLSKGMWRCAFCPFSSAWGFFPWICVYILIFFLAISGDDTIFGGE